MLGGGVGWGGWEEETRSGTEKRCSQNSFLQSGHPVWWSADNCSIFPTVNNIRSKKRTGRRSQKWLEKLKKIISCIFFSLAYRICLTLRCSYEEDMKHFWSGTGSINHDIFFGDFCRLSIKTCKRWPSFLKFQSMSIFAILCNRMQETVSVPKYCLE